MAFLKQSPARIVTPAHWEHPPYQFNERVVVYDYLNRVNTGVVHGMEYIDSEYIKAYGKDIGEGWHYAVLIDDNQPSRKMEPVMQVYQDSMMKYPANW